MQPAPRLIGLDLARSAALAGMVVYHFTYDLEMFGLIAPGTAVSGGWFVLARVVASSFLFLAGFSLVLAHGAGIRWRAYGRRLAMIAAAAAVISVGSWFAIPGAWVFFGILHAIAFGSLAGLMVLRLHPVAVAGLAVAVALAGFGLALPLFDTPGLQWLGLGTVVPRSVDFVPVFPWFAAVLAGIACAQAMGRLGLLPRGPVAAPGRVLRALAWPGRHSLAIYLLHQPVLVGGLWLALRLGG